MARRTPPLLFAIVSTFAVATLSSCSPSKDERPSAPDAAGSVHHGGRVIVALDSDPRTFDPLAMSTAQAARVFAMLQPGLVRLDPETGDWVPGLARSWDVDPRNRTVRLHLDPQLRWSDGTPFVANDVVATFTFYRDPATAYPRLERLAPIDSVHARDAHTVEVEFSEAVADPLALLAHDVLAAHVVARFDPEDRTAWGIGRSPVTLGPYRLADWAQDDRIVLERNPHHPAPAGRLDAIELVVVPDAPTRLLRLKAGEVDLVTGVDPAHLVSLEDDETISVVPIFGRSVAFLQYALDDPILSDVRVRRAIDLAVDRRALVEGILHGTARPAASFLPPVSWAHDADLEPTTRDLGASRRLLDEAGFVADSDGRRSRDGDRLVLSMLTVAGDPVREAVASALRAQLAEVGIEVQLRPMELASLMRIVRSDEFQLMLAQISGPADADVRPFFHSRGSYNFSRHVDARFDAWADSAVGAADREVARDAASRFQAYMADQQVVTCLYYPATLVAHRARLHGVRPDWTTPYAGHEQWWVDDAAAP